MLVRDKAEELGYIPNTDDGLSGNDIKEAVDAMVTTEKNVTHPSPILISRGEYTGDSYDEFAYLHNDDYHITELYWFTIDGIMAWPESGAIFDCHKDHCGSAFIDAFGDKSYGLHYEEDDTVVWVRNDAEKRYYQIIKFDQEYFGQIDFDYLGEHGPIAGPDDANSW